MHCGSMLPTTYFQGSGLLAASVCCWRPLSSCLTEPCFFKQQCSGLEGQINTDLSPSWPFLSLCQGLASTNSCDTVWVNEKKKKEDGWERASGKELTGERESQTTLSLPIHGHARLRCLELLKPSCKREARPCRLIRDGREKQQKDSGFLVA